MMVGMKWAKIIQSYFQKKREAQEGNIQGDKCKEFFRINESHPSSYLEHTVNPQQEKNVEIT